VAVDRLTTQAKPYLSDGVVQGLVDPRLGDGYDGGQLRRLMFVASLCVRAAAVWRPTMTQVRAETDNNSPHLLFNALAVLAEKQNFNPSLLSLQRVNAHCLFASKKFNHFTTCSRGSKQKGISSKKRVVQCHTLGMSVGVGLTDRA
jgi:hypothetical protein